MVLFETFEVKAVENTTQAQAASELIRYTTLEEARRLLARELTLLPATALSTVAGEPTLEAEFQ